MLTGKRILLIISGGIAAYKSLELIRLLKKSGADVRGILTNGGAQFITPLSVASLSANPCYTDLWSLKDESEMGHIRLSRECDLIVVAPASANMIAKMAGGMADDLAATTLLASDKPVMICPAMNPMMWTHAATQENIQTLQKRGVIQTGPDTGDMACGETGMGRMAEPEDILAAITRFFYANKPLAGYTALVTAGPTFEPIDPVRFIGNRSSGKQGYAIARALSDAGAAVTLITGPTSLPAPHGIETIHIETAREMFSAVQKTMPCDIAVCTAAVADWRPENQAAGKIKKNSDAKTPQITLIENPDILAAIAAPTPKRPGLVIGFAAETDNVAQNAMAKYKKKHIDWILANDVSGGKVFGADDNTVHFMTSQTSETWPTMSKDEVAKRLTNHIQTYFDALKTEPLLSFPAKAGNPNKN